MQNYRIIIIIEILQNTVTHANANSLPTLDFYYQAPTEGEINTVYEGQCPSRLTFL